MEGIKTACLKFSYIYLCLEKWAGVMPNDSSDCLGCGIMVHFYSFSVLSYSGHVILLKPRLTTTTMSRRKADHHG